MNQSFKQFQLRDFLLVGLEKLGISNPTPVQRQAIPAIMQGKDVIGQSQTGTGKTLAFLLPVLQQIDLAKAELQALILAPTRELTTQISDIIGQLTEGTDIEVSLIQGGVDINRQIQRLKRNPQIIVGTPGRVLDLITQQKLPSHTVRRLVIDEADMMLEMGFIQDVEKIMQKMKRDIQIMLFAATLPQKVAGMVNTFMKQPRHIDSNPEKRLLPAIENVIFKVRTGGKEKALLQLLEIYNPYLGIIFVLKKEQVDSLVTQLRQAGYKAESFHGDMQRGQRKQVIQRFREARIQLLVATDIASRGLDIEGVTHIFNFSPPVSADQYIHRIGRTGRAGDTGIAINIIVTGEEERLRFIEEKLHQQFKEKSIIDGTIVDKPVSRKASTKKITGPKAPTKKITAAPNAKKKNLSATRPSKRRTASPPKGRRKSK